LEGGGGGGTSRNQRSRRRCISETAAAAESRLGVVMKKRRRSKHERATMKIKDKIDQNRGDYRVSHVVHHEKKILDFGSIPYYK
jgi:hypothetical protein